MPPETPSSETNTLEVSTLQQAAYPPTMKVSWAQVSCGKPNFDLSIPQYHHKLVTIIHQELGLWCETYHLTAQYQFQYIPIRAIARVLSNRILHYHIYLRMQCNLLGGYCNMVLSNVVQIRSPYHLKACCQSKTRSQHHRPMFFYFSDKLRYSSSICGYGKSASF